MSKHASRFQKKVMSLGYRGKEIFKPLNTGHIDDRVLCVREWIANIFFYRKNGTVIMFDAGYNYDRLKEKMGWLDLDPAEIRHIFITHQDTDHVGAVERDSDGLFSHARLYLSEIENRYLTEETPRRVIFGLYQLPLVRTDNEKVLLQDGQIIDIDGIRVECILVPGHTWGHMVYLVDDAYLFTGDTLWFGPDGGYSFINSLAEDNELSKKSLKKLETLLRERNFRGKIITGHTGWTDDLDFAFAHIDQVCNSLKKQKPHDPDAPYDGYREDDDTEEKARTVMLEKQKEIQAPDYSNWVPKGMADGFAAGAAVTALGTAAAGKLIKDDRTRLAVQCAGGLLSAGCAAWAAWCFYARTQFSYDGNRKLSKSVIDGTVSYINDLPEGAKILDVGCGSGALSIACAKKFPHAEVTGIDAWGPEYANYSQKVCEKNARAEGVSNVSFRKGNTIRLDFADETFDCVTSNYVYHNIAGRNKQKLLKETLRTLKKGGVFAIHDLMSPRRYGNMQKFMQELKEEGYEDVRLIPTDQGLFMDKKEADLLLLRGSCLLIGKK